MRILCVVSRPRIIMLTLWTRAHPAHQEGDEMGRGVGERITFCPSFGWPFAHQKCLRKDLEKHLWPHGHTEILYKMFAKGLVYKVRWWIGNGGGGLRLCGQLLYISWDNGSA